MENLIFSWAMNADGVMVHVDSVSRGLKCGCICPHCKERLQARHGEIRAHGFAHSSDNRGTNLRICYMVTMYKLAEQIIQQEKKIRIPSYYGIFKEKDIEFTEVIVDSRYDREDKQPDVIATTADGKRYLIEFTFAYKLQHKEKIDYEKMNCVEVDLSSQTSETLHDFLLHSSENRRWLNNQTYFDDIESLYLDRGKQVKIVDERSCMECNLHYYCCAAKLKGERSPLIIENNGRYYRICKTQEYRERIKSLEEYMHPEYDAKERELSETAKIRPDLRTCHECKNNLSWSCRENGNAACGIYRNLGVPRDTPPDTAKICRSFRKKT